jgi:hypothetical protein
MVVAYFWYAASTVGVATLIETACVVFQSKPSNTASVPSMPGFLTQEARAIKITANKKSLFISSLLVRLSTGILFNY